MTYGTKDVAGTGERRNKYLDSYLDSGSGDNTELFLYLDTSIFRHTNNYLIEMSNLEIFPRRSACKQIGETVRKFDYATGGSVNNLQKKYQNMQLWYVSVKMILCYETLCFCGSSVYIPKYRSQSMV